KPCTLKAHLANHCQDVPENIQKYWRNKFIDDSYAYSRNLQLKAILPVQVSNDYDRILLKAWTVTNISFKVIENPFIGDLFKAHNPAYVLSS
ncbi:10517_t:CDS:1, partial [Cetraspora pellucida]